MLQWELDILTFFPDSLHTYDHMKFEYETVWLFVRKDAFLMSHDIHWNRAFKDFVREHQQIAYAAHGFGIIKKM